MPSSLQIALRSGVSVLVQQPHESTSPQRLHVLNSLNAPYAKHGQKSAFQAEACKHGFMQVAHNNGKKHVLAGMNCTGPAPVQEGRARRALTLGFDTAADDAQQPDLKRDNAILCRHCEALISSKTSTREVSGSHQHAFFNPSGILFELECFSDAAGCEVLGQATHEFSWFAGYTWRYALCAQCKTHLGWFFANAADSFFALISKRIIVIDENEDK